MLKNIFLKFKEFTSHFAAKKEECLAGDKIIFRKMQDTVLAGVDAYDVVGP